MQWGGWIWWAIAMYGWLAPISMSVAAAVKEPAVLMLLPMLRNGQANESFTQSAAMRLQQLGEEPRPGRLAPGELRCETSSCLAPIAQKIGAQRLMGGSVKGNGGRRYAVRMFLFEAAAKQPFITQDSTCNDCSEKQVEALVASLAAKLIELRSAAVPVGPLRMPPPTPPATATAESVGNRNPADWAEQLKAQTALTSKTREVAESALRAAESGTKSVELLRGQQDRTKEGVDRLKEATEKANASLDKLRELADKTRELTERNRQEIERSREVLVQLREGVDKARAISEAGRAAAESTRAVSERIQKGTEQNSAAMERVRAQDENLAAMVQRSTVSVDAAREQVDKLYPLLEKAKTASESAQRESVESKDAAKQSSDLAVRTNQLVEQLNALSGDLKAALTNVEPLRAAAEQTQQTARANATESDNLLKVAKADRVAAQESLQQSEQLLLSIKSRDASRGLSRGRKIAAGILGSLGGLVLGGAVALSALDGVVLNESYCSSEPLAYGCRVHPRMGVLMGSYALGLLLIGGSLTTIASPVGRAWQ